MSPFLPANGTLRAVLLETKFKLRENKKIDKKFQTHQSLLDQHINLEISRLSF
jgi:hypothetical protein